MLKRICKSKNMYKKQRSPYFYRPQFVWKSEKNTSVSILKIHPLQVNRCEVFYLHHWIIRHLWIYLMGMPFTFDLIWFDLIHWLIDWLIDLLIDWLVDWLIDWLIDWSVDWLIDWLIDWWIDWLIDWLIDSIKSPIITRNTKLITHNTVTNYKYLKNQFNLLVVLPSTSDLWHETVSNWNVIPKSLPLLLSEHFLQRAISVFLSLCLSVCMSVCLPVSLSACRSVGLSVCWSINWFIDLLLIHLM